MSNPSVVIRQWGDNVRGRAQRGQGRGRNARGRSMAPTGGQPAKVYTPRAKSMRVLRRTQDWKNAGDNSNHQTSHPNPLSPEKTDQGVCHSCQRPIFPVKEHKKADLQQWKGYSVTCPLCRIKIHQVSPLHYKEHCQGPTRRQPVRSSDFEFQEWRGFQRSKAWEKINILDDVHCGPDHGVETQNASEIVGRQLPFTEDSSCTFIAMVIPSNSRSTVLYSKRFREPILLHWRFGKATPGEIFKIVVNRPDWGPRLGCLNPANSSGLQYRLDPELYGIKTLFARDPRGSGLSGKLMVRVRFQAHYDSQWRRTSFLNEVIHWGALINPRWHPSSDPLQRPYSIQVEAERTSVGFKVYQCSFNNAEQTPGLWTTNPYVFVGRLPRSHEKAEDTPVPATEKKENLGQMDKFVEDKTEENKKEVKEEEEQMTFRVIILPEIKGQYYAFSPDLGYAVLMDQSIGIKTPGKVFGITIAKADFRKEDLVLSRSNSTGKRIHLPTNESPIRPKFRPENGKDETGPGELDMWTRFVWEDGRWTNEYISIEDLILENGGKFIPIAGRQVNDLLFVSTQTALDALIVRKVISKLKWTNKKPGHSRVEHMDGKNQPILQSNSPYVRPPPGLKEQEEKELEEEDWEIIDSEAPQASSSQTLF